jgi:hypothetical protein
MPKTGSSFSVAFKFTAELRDSERACLRAFIETRFLDAKYCPRDSADFNEVFSISDITSFNAAVSSQYGNVSQLLWDLQGQVLGSFGSVAVQGLQLSEGDKVTEAEVPRKCVTFCLRGQKKAVKDKWRPIIGHLRRLAVEHSLVAVIDVVRPGFAHHEYWVQVADERDRDCLLEAMRSDTQVGVGYGGSDHEDFMVAFRASCSAPKEEDECKSVPETLRIVFDRDLKDYSFQRVCDYLAGIPYGFHDIKQEGDRVVVARCSQMREFKEEYIDVPSFGCCESLAGKLQMGIFSVYSPCGIENVTYTLADYSYGIVPRAPCRVTVRIPWSLSGGSLNVFSRHMKRLLTKKSMPAAFAWSDQTSHLLSFESKNSARTLLRAICEDVLLDVGVGVSRFGVQAVFDAFLNKCADLYHEELLARKRTVCDEVDIASESIAVRVLTIRLANLSPSEIGEMLKHASLQLGIGEIEMGAFSMRITFEGEGLRTPFYRRLMDVMDNPDASSLLSYDADRGSFGVNRRVLRSWMGTQPWVPFADLRCGPMPENNGLVLYKAPSSSALVARLGVMGVPRRVSQEIMVEEVFDEALTP